MPSLWPSSSLYEEVRSLQDMLPGVGPPGGDSRCGQGKLVKG